MEKEVVVSQQPCRMHCPSYRPGKCLVVLIWCPAQQLGWLGTVATYPVTVAPYPVAVAPYPVAVAPLLPLGKE